jgi:hypothetical protein
LTFDFCYTPAGDGANPLIINDFIQLTRIPQGQEIIMITINDLGQVFVEKEEVNTKAELNGSYPAFRGTSS